MKDGNDTSWQHWDVDAAMFKEWQIDYLKSDPCCGKLPDRTAVFDEYNVRWGEAFRRVNYLDNVFLQARHHVDVVVRSPLLSLSVARLNVQKMFTQLFALLRTHMCLCISRRLHIYISSFTSHTSRLLASPPGIWSWACLQPE